MCPWGKGRVWGKATVLKSRDSRLGLSIDRDLILGDNALLYIAYVMLIWAPLIPATRWSCSTLDCRYRGFRFKSVEDSLCKICNVVQSVDHVLLHCKGSNLKSNRTIFENKFCKYVPNNHSLSDEDKLQIVLNFKPLWKKVNESEACEAIYTFVKNTYQSAQGLNFCDKKVLLTLVNKLYLLTLLTCSQPPADNI